MSDEPRVDIPAEDEVPDFPATEDLALPEPEYVGDGQETGNEEGLPDSAVDGDEPEDDD